MPTLWWTLTLLLMFIGRVPLRHMAVMVGIGIVLGGAGLAAGQRLGTVMSRVTSFTDKTKKTPFQLEHSYIAIATGGIAGKGPGKSTERNRKQCQQTTDAQKYLGHLQKFYIIV